MRPTADMRPHLTDARRTANETYLRRRARSAADMLLDIDPAHWDEHTRKVLLETLPRLARIEPWEVRALEQDTDPLEPLRVQQDTGCPDCWQDKGAIHSESCRVAIQLRKWYQPIADAVNRDSATELQRVDHERDDHTPGARRATPCDAFSPSNHPCTLPWNHDGAHWYGHTRCR